MNRPVKPVEGVKATAPSAPTETEPPVPNVTAAPAALVVAVPGRDPPPNDVTVASGKPRLSLASTPGAAIVRAVSKAVW